MGVVTSLEKPHNAKQVVIMQKGSNRLTPFFINSPLFFSIFSSLVVLGWAKVAKNNYKSAGFGKYLLILPQENRIL
jgi:hypothetical protein